MPARGEEHGYPNHPLHEPMEPYHPKPYTGGTTGSAAITSTLAKASWQEQQRQLHEHDTITGLEAEISSLRIKNSWLMEENGRFSNNDSKEKIAVLAELNDKLELDLDLALKELSLNKRKADGCEAQLIKVQARNNALEVEVANLRADHTKSEQRVAAKRDWAEKRLNDEESTMTDLQNQVRSKNSEIQRQKEEHQRYKDNAEKEYNKQIQVIETMKETYRKRLAEAEEGRRTAAAQSRAVQNAQASDVFHAFDANGDGVMDEAEFAAAFAQFAKPRHNPYPAPDAAEQRFDYQKRRYIAMFDCPADSPDELDMKEGDIVQVIAEGDAGWWIARKGSKEGMVPSNYLKLHNSEQ